MLSSLMLIGSALLPIEAWAQAQALPCTTTDVQSTVINATSALSTIELRGFDQRTDPGAGNMYKKFLSETWSGYFDFYREFMFNGWTYQITSNQTYSGTWLFSPDGLTNASAKAIEDNYSEVINDPLDGGYAPSDITITGFTNSIEQRLTGASFGVDYPYMAPLNWVDTVTTSTLNLPNDLVENASGEFLYNIQVQETESDEFTAAIAQEVEAPPTTTGNSRLAYTMSPNRPWASPLSDTRITPMDYTQQTVNFTAEFPSSGPNALSPGKYDISYYYTQWPLGTTQPSGPNVVLPGGTVTFKDAPFLAPSSTSPVQIQAPVGYNMEIEYAVATPCIACNCTVGGDGKGSLSSVHFRVSLGTLSNGLSAGQLMLVAPQISSQLYSTSAWNPVVATSPDVQLVTDASGNLLQVKTPNWLVDLVQTSASVCDVNCYQVSQITGTNPATLRYTLSGSPFATYEATDPASDGGSGNQLMISEIRGSVVRQTTFSNYSASTGSGVTMTYGPGYGKERISQATSGTTVTEVRDMVDDSGNLLSQKTTTYNLTPYGQVVASISVATGVGAPLVTQYSYYDNPSTDGASYGHVKQALNPDGSWANYVYDTQGRVAQVLRPYLNSTPTTDPTQCRATSTTYSTLPDADGDGIPETLIQVVTTVLGTETGRSYNYEPSNTLVFNGDTCLRVDSIRCVQSGAAWNATGNLVRTTYSYSGGNFGTQPRAILNPDGTATLTALSLDGNGNRIATVKTGQLNPAKTDVVSGTMTITVSSLASNSPVSVTYSDIASGAQLSFWTATQTDQWGRPTVIANSDGTTDARTYACCGLGSETDKEGITTSYNYDLAGRLISTSRAGITTLLGYDPAGRVLSVTRQGADGTRIVQQSSTYDLAGRKISSADPLNRVTTYTHNLDSTGEETINNTVNPDGGTRIEVYASDGSPLSVSGTAAATLQYNYGVDSNGFFTQAVRVGSQGQTTEWVKDYVDAAGRPTLTVYPDGATAQNRYNILGQLAQAVDPDGVSTLYGYDTIGRQTVVAIDMDRNGTIDYSGIDRIASTVPLVTTDHATTVQQTTTTAWTTLNAPTTQILSVNETSANGLQNWQTANGLTTTSQTVYNGSGSRTETTTTADGVQTVSQYQNDLLASKTISQGSIGILSATSYAYDPHGRLQTSTDARNGTTTYTYFADDQIQTVTTPNPNAVGGGSENVPQTTTYGYGSAGRVSQITEPDGSVVNNVYFPTGQLQETFGSQTYHQGFTYDSQGRVKTLSTWQSFSAGAGNAVTSWNYDSARGWLSSKIYADGNGPGYGYWPSGRLKTRTWARGVTASYTYGNAGDLAFVAYSDSTPAVSMTYNRLGQLSTATDAAGTCSYTYDPSGQLQNETYGATGLLGTYALGRTFDSMDRLASLTLAPLSPFTYGYDAASRLQTVTNGANSSTYAYLPNSNLIGTINFQNSGVTTLTTNRVYDYLSRLSSVTSTPSAGPPISHAYLYNSANQRIQLTREDGSYWQFGYDPLGQVILANKNLSSGTPISGYGFTATFDDIGNRTSTTVNDQPFAYAANALNQYSQRTVPGIVDVVGTANPSATVTANFQRATQQGSLFYDGLASDNAGGPQYVQINIEAVVSDAGPNGQDAIMQSSRSAFLPKTPEAFGYDLDGNLTSDGRWLYTWDGENRLIAMQTAASASAAGTPNQKLTFAYDLQGRRVQKTVANWSSSTYVLASDLRFVYDGWNLLAEFDALHGNTVVRSYAWGLDLSGSLQGAGGVGGLLEFTDSGSGTAYFAATDGNGNIAGLISISTGLFAAQYEYGAFGQPIQASGTAAALNPFRFSSRYTDTESDEQYYGQRYYNPGTGRWLSRDSIEEQGGANLYGFVKNSPIDGIDALGESSLKDIALEQMGLNGGVSFTRTFPIGAIGPVPVFLTLGAQGKVFQCTNSGHQETWAEVDFLAEAYGRVGFGYDDRERFPDVKSHNRNNHVPDPYNPGDTIKQKNLAGRLVDPSGIYRDRGAFSDLLSNQSCNCPNADFEGSVTVFVRGSAGVGYFGAQASFEQKLLASDDINGPDVKFSVAVGVIGATLEAGFGGHAKFVGPLPGTQ